METIRMRKTLLSLFTVLSALGTGVVCAGQEETPSKFNFYGYVANYMVFDTREVSAGTQDLFFFMPKDVQLSDDGVDEILIELFRHAPEGEMLYDENTWTDQDLEFRIAEIIREKAMNSVTAEIPYAIMTEVSDLEYNETENKVWIRAFITVERESQKGIMVGKGGENIKKIRIASFKDIRKIFPQSKLELDLRVRVNGKWKSNDAILSKVFKETQA